MKGSPSPVQKPSKTGPSGSFVAARNNMPATVRSSGAARTVSGAPHIAKRAPGKLNHNPAVNMHSSGVDSNAKTANQPYSKQ